MLNTRYPCPALDPYNNSNVREIRFLAVANSKSNSKHCAQNISTLWLPTAVLGRGRGTKRERERERERGGDSRL